MTEDEQELEQKLLTKIQKELDVKKENRKKRKANGDYFNIFELCGIAEKENTHSNIIANLLSPGWNHGQGNVFLKKFCERLGILFDSQSNTTVVREEVIPGRRPDIVIRNDSNLIVIENKTGTCDHEDQLQDYWKWMSEDNSNANVAHKTLIYLTLAGEHPRCNLKIENVYDKALDNGDNVSKYKSYGSEKMKFILLPYAEIRDWCAYCSIISGVPECVADAFKQYANFIELWLNNETDDSDIIELCAQEEYLDAVQNIYVCKEVDKDRLATYNWIKNNYAQIIKTYIAAQFPNKAWGDLFLELKQISGTIFSVCVEFTKNYNGYIRIGITQTEKVNYRSECDKELQNKLQGEFKNFKCKVGDDNCWWIISQEIAKINSRTQIKEELKEKISDVNALLNRTDLQVILSDIKFIKES